MKTKLKILLCLTVIIATVLSQGLFFQVYAVNSNPVNYEKSNATDREYVDFTETNIKTTDMRKKSRIDKEKFSEYMKKFPNLSGIEDTLIEIQDEYDVNAILILAIVRLESGNGKSSIAQSKNNLGGLVGGSENSVAVYKSFDTKSDCVVYMAKLISSCYLTEGGKYFNGYTISDIAKRYCEAPDEWSRLVESMIRDIQKGLNEIQISNS